MNPNWEFLPACYGDLLCTITAQKMFPIKDFFSKCDQINSFLQIWSHLLKKILNEKLLFLRSVGKYGPKKHLSRKNFAQYYLVLGNKKYFKEQSFRWFFVKRRIQNHFLVI